MDVRGEMGEAGAGVVVGFVDGEDVVRGWTGASGGGCRDWGDGW